MSKDLEIDVVADRLIGEAETVMPRKQAAAFKRDVNKMRGPAQRSLLSGNKPRIF